MSGTRARARGTTADAASGTGAAGPPGPAAATPDLTAEGGRRLVVHGSALAWHGRGLLLRGPSGSGKSALTLRMLGAGAVLVADDLVALRPCRGGLLAAPVGVPAGGVGLIEARGLGIFRLVASRGTPLSLIVDLTAGAVAADAVDVAPGDAGDGGRLPARRVATLLGTDLPVVAVHGGAADAPERILLALVARRAA